MENIDFILNLLSEDAFNSVTPPIYQTSNFRFDDVASFRDAMADEEHKILYSRGNNTTLNVLADKLGALDGGKALLFSSGMGAISTAILSVVKAGKHALCIEGAYSWTNTIFKDILPNYGVDAETAPAAELIGRIRPDTCLVYLESPLTKTFEVCDIQAISDAAHQVGAVVMLDNSYSTPLLQRPMDMGVDYVLYSATKYIGGHSDAVGGVLVCREEFYSTLFNKEFLAFGSIMSPFNAYLFLRGLRTMPIRLQHIGETAKKVMSFLEQHPAVEKVLYPGAHSQEQKMLAERQMKGISGLFSVILKNKSPEVMERFCNELKYFRLAVSWGGHESLALPYILWKDSQNSGMVRLSIGLESAEVLIEDLGHALSVAL